MFWGCCAASGCLECVHGIMKSGDYQGILEHNVQPSVRKLGIRRRTWVLQQQDNDPQTHFKRHPGMVQDKTLDCSEVASNESRSKSNWTPVGRSENSSWEKAPFKSGRTGAVWRRAFGQTARRSAGSSYIAIGSAWLQLFCPKDVLPNIYSWGCQ